MSGLFYLIVQKKTTGLSRWVIAELVRPLFLDAIQQ